MDIEKLMKELKKDISILVKDKFGEESDNIKKDINTFLEASKEKLKRWTKLFAEGSISKEELELLIKSQKDLFVIKSLHTAGVSNIALGHFKNKIVFSILMKIVAFVL